MARPESDSRRSGSVDETTPLIVTSILDPTLTGQEDEVLHQQNNGRTEGDDTPLPKLQIALLCYARVVEPIAYFSIFPFINEMVQVTGKLDEVDVGFYVGLIESLFSITQMLFMIPWGRAADRFGRKPVLVISLIGVSIATTLFGLSTELWHMILFRCIGGAFAGTVLTVRAMISENSTPKTQARAFSWFSFSSNMGIFAGPFIGGVLSNPATELPYLFGHVQFFIDYPYALSTFITGSIGATAAITISSFVKETLTPDRRTSNKASAQMSTWELIKYPGVATVIYIYGHVMILAYAYTSISSTFNYTKVKFGGFGFSNFQISLFIALAGFSQAMWTLVAFTPLQHRFGTGAILRWCAIAWPISFAIFPLCNTFLRKEWKIAFWITAPLANAVGSGVSMAFTGVQLALNDIAPSHATLGTLNGIALAVGAGLRAIAPALFASIFATGVKYQIFAGYLIWVVLILLAIPLILGLYWLPAKAEGKIYKRVHEERSS